MRVHFNIDYGVYVPDLEGVDLPDLGAARTEATRALGDFILEMPQSLWLGEFAGWQLVAGVGAEIGHGGLLRLNGLLLNAGRPRWF